MSTPSKEALEAAKELFPDAISFYRFVAENAAEIIDRHFAALRAANAELQKQEAESRQLFYAEQDKRQSAEFRCEELAGALREVASLLSKNVNDFGGCDHSVGVCMCEEIRACDNAAEVLARHAAGEPEAQK